VDLGGKGVGIFVPGVPGEVEAHLPAKGVAYGFDVGPQKLGLDLRAVT
jgi:hypothetical protein